MSVCVRPLRAELLRAFPQHQFDSVDISPAHYRGGHAITRLVRQQRVDERMLLVQWRLAQRHDDIAGFDARLIRPVSLRKTMGNVYFFFTYEIKIKNLK